MEGVKLWFHLFLTSAPNGIRELHAQVPSPQGTRYRYASKWSLEWTQRRSACFQRDKFLCPYQERNHDSSKFYPVASRAGRATWGGSCYVWLREESRTWDSVGHKTKRNLVRVVGKFRMCVCECNNHFIS